MKVEGGCYCGNVRYRATGEPVMRAQCNCRECQYISGGSSNLILGMPVAGFEFTKGTAKPFTRTDLENPVTREFCPDCGTHLLSRLPGLPIALLKVGTLDEPAIFEGPQMVVFTIDSQPFHQNPEGIPTFERLPG